MSVGMVWEQKSSICSWYITVLHAAVSDLSPLSPYNGDIYTKYIYIYMSVFIYTYTMYIYIYTHIDR